MSGTLEVGWKEVGWKDDLEVLFRVWVRERGILPCREGNSPRASLRGQVGADMDEIVGDHAESDPTSDAVWSSIK